MMISEQDRMLKKRIEMAGHEHRFKLISESAQYFENGIVYWQTMRTAWMTNEIFAEIGNEQLHDLTTRHRRCRGAFMNLTERKELKKLAESFVIFRGTSELNPMGWSWTLDEEQAVWFARRWPIGKEAFVLRGTIDKSDVIGFLSGRGESEIVVSPWDVQGAHRVRDYGDLPMSEADKLGYMIRTGRFVI